LRVALVSLLLALSLLAPTTDDEHSDQRAEGSDDRCKPHDALSKRYQSDPADDCDSSQNEAENLPESFSSNISFNDGLLKVLTVFRLRLCHLDDAFGATRKDSVVLI
jgi:hypothetical protein